MSKNNKEFLTVVVLAYNQELYIRDCLEGIMVQKTNFRFNLLIHDDASSDGTMKIINEFKEKYPKQIKVISQSQNQFSKNKAVFSSIVFPKLNCKYIAICEGDDNWLVPDKLQKQVDFLEKNTDYVMTFHAVEIIKEKKYKHLPIYPPPPHSNLDFNDLLHKNYIPTASLVARKDCIPHPIPKWVDKCLMEDTALKLLIADKGKTKYFSEKMGVYRKHSMGITSDKERLLRARASYLFMYKKLRASFGENRYWALTKIILKTRLGKLKDYLGINPSLKESSVNSKHDDL